MSGAKLLLALAVLVFAGLVFVLTWGGGESLPTPAAMPARSPATGPSARAPQTEAPAKATPVTLEIDDDDTGIVEVDLTNSPDFYSMLTELGIEDVEERLADWGVTRGYPKMDEQGNPILDQPYHQYDEATLRAFADNGDMWAQQILADRLADSRPADALELYRQAAIAGSRHAMTEMARLYRKLAFSRSDKMFEDDPESLEQLYALRDAPESLAVTGYAWAAVAEKAGWDPLRGGMTASFVGAKLTGEQLRSACEYADSIFGELVQERDNRDLPAYDRAPPPVVFDPGATGGTACNDNVTDTLAGCKEIHVRVGDQVSRIWTCDN